MSEAILIAAQAGRALAEAARRAGLRPFVADLFGDSDTLALSEAYRPLPGRFGSRIAADATLAAIDDLAACAGSRLGIVLGSGFEDTPDLVARIAARHRLIGADADAVAALKDPLGFAALCDRFRIPHPAIATGPLPDPSGWLLKRVGGSGGSHIRPATRGPTPEGHYVQARAPGRPHALNFLADGRTMQVLAVTEQWCAPSPMRPYRYGGALVGAAAEAPPLPEPLLQAVAAAVESLIAATGLRGLASADFLADETGWWLTEINPRPGATLDILDRRSTPLLAAHIEASLGAMPALGPQPADAAAAQICYADREHAPVPDCPWPDHVRDRPRPGTVVRRDAPLCTVLALGADRQAALDSLKTRTARLQADLAAKKTHPEETL
ncbi:putative ATP-grasp superfamily ATP-dependent carboligase [Methylobacterium brachiatum]|uniref:ATP-grasp superfamily ATP-dependent carboligase n=1 Tax=Methylobacterium brachiatum TaxID=269660 RepID=A0AAJ1TIK7_9HYPH|nr:ATP-grasp domain-containing protein [Methylobacterium brachiatum]MCB4800941.1 ATP-grasp domain-containing protein [Methylobacterium brachiatum]MDQ0541291.1 putative ATP-grasp superfamily ATP-dependent carboligase [Methylobacterium brachiatum]